MAQAAQAVFTSGGDAQKAMEQARNANLALQRERDELAALMLRLGEYDGAGQAAANAVELNPNQHQAWTTLAIVAGIKGDEERCEKCVQKAVECGQEEKALRSAIAHYKNIAERDSAREA